MMGCEKDSNIVRVEDAVKIQVHVMELKYTLTEELKCTELISVYKIDLTVIVKEHKNIEDVKRRQQQGTLCWERSLKIIGRSLKPSK